MAIKLKRSIAFVFLLPLFFVWHGMVAHYNYIPPGDALVLLSVYTAGVLLAFALTWLLYRNATKAALVTFFISGCFFFFGIVQDFMKQHFTGTFFARYSFLFICFLTLLAALVIWLKKRKQPLAQLVSYLNILLLVLLLVDTGWLLSKIFSRQPPNTYNIPGARFSPCDTCHKPDIYFIVLDEYAGNTALKELFGFDNTRFLDQLNDRHFFVAQESRSNYHFTPYSVASTLNMDYLKTDMKKDRASVSYCYNLIRNSRALRYLQASGYKFYNYSFFDFDGQPAMKTGSFLPNKTDFITRQTFSSRFMDDVGFDILSGKKKFRPALENLTYNYLRDNENIISLTQHTAGSRDTFPKFVYTHLIMPHYPYYFDSNSNPMPLEKLTAGNEYNMHSYVEYMQYANKRILALADHIKEQSATDPVIILLGDHGFRHFREKQEPQYYFMNLYAVYLPSKKHQWFYDNMSNVNLFRSVFNTVFQQQLPLLKDSTTYLWD